MKIVTIARNRKAHIDALFARSTGFRCYSLSNEFSGRSVTEKVVRDALGCGGKLTHASDSDVYTVRIHSNLWYEFKVAAVVEAHPACCGCADCEVRYAA